MFDLSIHVDVDLFSRMSFHRDNDAIIQVYVFYQKVCSNAGGSRNHI